MRIAIAAVAALMALMPAGGVLAESLDDEVQDEEQPGSEIEMEIGGGGVEIGRKGNMPPPSPVEVEGEVLDVPVGPTDPAEIDPTDDELPGEGPEDLSGPDDEDPLPD
jgi:hypothetical protein